MIRQVNSSAVSCLEAKTKQCMRSHSFLSAIHQAHIRRLLVEDDCSASIDLNDARGREGGGGRHGWGLTVRDVVGVADYAVR